MSNDDSVSCDKISTEAISALIMEYNDTTSSDFIKNAHKRVFENPSLLSEHWIRSINTWGREISKGIEIAEEGNVFEEKNFESFEFKIIKVTKRYKAYGSRAKFKDFIAENDNGWKYWFRLYYDYIAIRREDETGIPFRFPRKNDVVSCTAIVRENKMAFTFLGLVEKFSIK